jgi:hypothetical protein
MVERAGIPVTEHCFCKTAAEARETAERIGGPTVIKSQVLTGSAATGRRRTGKSCSGTARWKPRLLQTLTKRVQRPPSADQSSAGRMRLQAKGPH